SPGDEAGPEATEIAESSQTMPVAVMGESRPWQWRAPEVSVAVHSRATAARGGPGMPEQASSKSLVEKLGVGRGARVSVLRAGDRSFVAELEARGADVSSRARKESHLIFAGVERLADLSRL